MLRSAEVLVCFTKSFRCVPKHVWISLCLAVSGLRSLKRQIRTGAGTAYSKGNRRKNDHCYDFFRFHTSVVEVFKD